MSLKNLDNLVKAGQLKIEAFNKLEFVGLVDSGQKRLKDANNTSLAIESRFDLAYTMPLTPWRFLHYVGMATELAIAILSSKFCLIRLALGQRFGEY